MLKELIRLATLAISRRSMFFGTKHIDHMFKLQFGKRNNSPYQIAEAAIARLQMNLEKKYFKDC